MKARFLLTVLTLLLFIIGVKAQTSQAKIVFETTEHDFGTFKEAEGPQSYNFAFVNQGATPLILNNVQASCGCTTPEWTKKPIAPGEKGFIKVSYNPANRPGPFNKSITVSSNGEVPRTVLRIKGTVQQREKTIAELYPRQIGAVRAKTNHIAFVKIKENEVKTDSLEIVNDSDQPVSLDFKTPPENLTVKVVPSTLKPKEKGQVIVTYDASKINSYGFVMHRIYLNVDGKADYRNSIGVSATIEEDFSALSPQELANAPVATFSEETHEFGDINEGDKVECVFTLKNAGKRDLIIRNVKTSCGCTAVTPEKKVVAANESVPLKVVFNSRGKRGRQNKAITVITNDPKNPTTILRISTNVKTAG
ncbi:DUF1573 domain-containing protein [Mangrovibacterium marinum]|uniref:Uncharacterized protein DUF1573 n=1 Tax=Mangrovibacterium marinum TaxID=1639118 RepID=A0A2T5C249_9BACT|nr:DUF1573 domain-containing protein [Mangrovibacterium marinum]PTN08727.1 uncharacterized protein DUF1573 [Mangrovibacterium marinum]